MAIRKKEEMLKILSDFIGDNNSDDAIALIEDVSDSYDSFADPEDWKSKYDELDADWKSKYDELDTSWRNKYKERFFDGTNETPTEEKVDGDTHLEQDQELLTYDDFFASIEIDEESEEK